MKRTNEPSGDFLAAFRDAVRAAAAGWGFPPQLEMVGPLDTVIPDAVRHHLLAVVAEALSGVARHSAAEHVYVRMSIEGSPATGSVVLTVRTDGRGPPEDTTDNGLRNLRDRAALVGGSCVVESTPGGGTSLRWAASLARPAAYPGTPDRGAGPPTEAQLEVTKDGRSWQLGTNDEVAWIAAGTAAGRTITCAIPPVFAAYATFHELDDTSIVGHERAVVQHLADHSGDQQWWLGYLDTGAHDVVFDEATRVTLYTGWDYVLVRAGPAQSLTWRTGHIRAGDGSLPDLIFPADRSWLLSGLWDDAWTCVGGPVELIADLQRDHQVQARRVELGQDAAPPGREML